MAYYEEYYERDHVPQTLVYSNNPASTSATWVQESVWMKGWRTSPPSSAIWYRELLPTEIDPYAYFLENESKRRYHENLRSRNLPEQGSPDRGHPWFMMKHTLRGTRMSPINWRKSFGSSAFTMSFDNPVLDSGYVTLDEPYQVPLTPYVTIPSGLDTFAQQAYARSAATSVIFDAAQFLGELREGLPRLGIETIRSATKFYKGLGSDYLNVEFGWKPFINDLIKMGQALSGATSMLKGVNQRVHRRFRLPTQYQSWNANISSKSNVLGMRGLRDHVSHPGWVSFPSESKTWASGPSGPGSVTRTRETTRWFEGEFTNFMPLGFDPKDYFQRLNALVNVKLTPSVLWELAPWSWLVDWNLRIGDTIKANELAANDLLVMHYGYAMEHQVQRDLVSYDLSAVPRSKTGSGSSYNYWSNFPDHVSWISETTLKRRLRANPYGFKIGGTGALNASQYAILGALGLTKAR